MIIDIIKFFFIYMLVLFAFGCGNNNSNKLKRLLIIRMTCYKIGLNQLMWYYSDLERKECYSLPGGLPDWENKEESCFFWRRFAK